MPSFAEFILYLLWTLVVLEIGWRTLREERLLQMLAMAIVIVFPVAQVVRNARLTYPFASWDMYSQVTPTRLYWTFELELADGRRTDFPSDLFALASPGPLAGYSTLNPIKMRLLRMQNACGCSRGSVQLDSLIRRVVDHYEERNMLAVRKFTMSRHVFAPPAQTLPTTIYTWQDEQ